MDEKTKKLIEDLNRGLFLISDACRTDEAIVARDKAQQAVIDLENELKGPDLSGL